MDWGVGHHFHPLTTCSSSPSSNCGGGDGGWAPSHNLSIGELWLPQIGQGCSLTHHYWSFNHGVLAPFSWCCSPQDRLCFLLSSPVVFYGVIIELLLPAPCFASSLFTLLPIFSVLLFYVDLGVLLICSQLLSSSIRHSLIASNSSVSPYFHLHN